MSKYVDINRRNAEVLGSKYDLPHMALIAGKIIHLLPAIKMSSKRWNEEHVQNRLLLHKAAEEIN